MRLRHKLIALCVIVAAAPLATIGLLTVRWNQDALEAEIRARHEAVAHHAASAVSSDLGGLVKRLDRAAAAFDWAALGPAEIDGALRLVYREDARITAAVLTGEDGAPLRAAVFPAEAADGHPRATPPGVATFLLRAPARRAIAEGAGVIVLSPVYDDEEGDRRAPRIALALPRTCRAGQLCAVCVEIDLGGLLGRLATTPDLRLLVIDADGRKVVDTGGRDRPGQDLRHLAVVRDFVERRPGPARRYVEGGVVLIAAYAPVPTLGWGVIVERGAAEAFAPARRMRTLTVGWTLVATVFAIALAGLFARRLTGALGLLAEGARAFGAGRLDHRVDARGRDEIGALGGTLNTMAGELAASRAEIVRWNRELEQRVEERTRELRAAQAQLLQAQKLAALGQLGAGVAHEINNPLAGVIGHVQLLLTGRAEGDRDLKALRCIDEAARRASTIVQNLLRFSVQHERAVMTTVDLNRLLRDTVSLAEQAIRDQGITITWRLEERAPRARGDAGQLAQVLLNLVQNARTAMKEAGGTLTLATFGDADAPTPVGFRVTDTGKGIAPAHRERLFEPFFTTKDEWSNVGLGLSVSYRLVAEHGGRVAVDSEVGTGSTFTVYLPAA